MNGNRICVLCDQSASTQQFRKRIGMTPKEFRTQHHG